MRYLGPCLSLCVLSCASSTAPRPADKSQPAPVVANEPLENEPRYAVKIGRQLGVGEQFDEKRTVTQHGVIERTVGAGAKTTETWSARTESSAVMEATSLDESGNEAGWKYVFDAFEATDRDAKRWSLPKGTTVLVECAKKREDAKILIDGKQPSPRLRRVLETAISATLSTPPSGDEMYGSTEPRRLGETWPAQADLVVKDFANEDVIVRREDVNASVTLRGVRLGELGPVRLVRIESAVANVLPQPPGSSYTYQPGTHRYVADWALGPDGKFLSATAHVVTVSNMRGKTAEGEDEAKLYTYERHSTWTSTPLSVGPAN